MPTDRLWTKEYAKDPALVNKEKVARLMEMGFSEAVAKDALTKNGYNEEAAVLSLLGK